MSAWILKGRKRALDDYDVSFKERIPAFRLEQSKYFSHVCELFTNEGEQNMIEVPISVSALEEWASFQTSSGATTTKLCRILQVANFLEDETTVSSIQAMLLGRLRDRLGEHTSSGIAPTADNWKNAAQLLEDISQLTEDELISIIQLMSLAEVVYAPTRHFFMWMEGKPLHIFLKPQVLDKSSLPTLIKRSVAWLDFTLHSYELNKDDVGEIGAAFSSIFVHTISLIHLKMSANISKALIGHLSESSIVCLTLEKIEVCWYWLMKHLANFKWLGHLHIFHCKLELTRKTQKNEIFPLALKELKLHDNKIKSRAAFLESLFNSLQPTLGYLLMSEELSIVAKYTHRDKPVLGKSILKAIAPVLGTMKQLIHLDLDASYVCRDGLQILSPHLLKLSCVTNLTMSFLSDDSGNNSHLLADVLPKLPLRELDLESISEDSTVLAKLSAISSLTVLRLRHFVVDNETTGPAFLSGLSSILSLKKLLIEPVHVHHAAVRSLADSLVHMPVLSSLDVSNLIGTHNADECALHFLSKLQKLTRLESLDMSHCSLHGLGRQVADAIATCSRLSRLSLYDTRLTCSDVTAISNMLSKLVDLRYLNLGVNDFADEGGAALATCLPKLSYLTSLCLCLAKRLEDTAWASLAESFSSLKHLKYFDCRGCNDMSCKAARVVCKKLMDCKQLDLARFPDEVVEIADGLGLSPKTFSFVSKSFSVVWGMDED